MVKATTVLPRIEHRNSLNILNVLKSLSINITQKSNNIKTNVGIRYNHSLTLKLLKGNNSSFLLHFYF